MLGTVIGTVVWALVRVYGASAALVDFTFYHLTGRRIERGKGKV